MIKFYKQHSDKIFLILSVVLGLVPLIWLTKGEFIAGEEFYAVDYARWGRLFSNGWSSSINFGEYSILTPFRLQGLFFELLNLIRLSPKVSIVIWHSGLWMVGSVSFYLLSRRIFPDASPEVSFVTTIYYSLSQYFLNISILLSPARIVFAILPSILLVSNTYFRDKKNMARSEFKLALIVFLASPVFVNIPIGAALLMFVFGIILFKAVFVESKLVSFIKSASLFTVLFFAINAWWVFPITQKLFGHTQQIQQGTSSFVTIDKTSVADVVTGLGSWAFREKAVGTFYFPHSETFDKFPLLLLRYIPFALILTALYSLSIDKGRRRPTLLFLFIAYLIFLILAKGTSGFGGGVFKFAYDKIPGFWIFREPYAKFMPFAVGISALLLTPGIMYLGQVLSKLFKNKKLPKPILNFLLGVTFLLLAYPFFNRVFLGDTNLDAIRSSIVIMPDYWKSFSKEWRPQDGNYIKFPSLKLTDLYRWPSGHFGNPFLMFTDAKLINREGGSTSNNVKLAISLYDKILQDPESLIESAVKYNLAGIIFQGDTTYENISSQREKVRNLYGKYLEYSNSKIDIYNFKAENMEVELIPKESVFMVDSDPLEAIKLMEYFSPNNYYLARPHAESNDDYIIVGKADNFFTEDVLTTTHNLPAIPSGKYSVTIIDDHEALLDIKVDEKEIPFSRIDNTVMFELNYDNSCCSSLHLRHFLGDDILLGNSWEIFEGSVTDSKRTDGNKLVIVPGKVAYLKKISSLNLLKEYVLNMDIKKSGNLGLKISVIQRDLDTGATKDIFNVVTSSVMGRGAFDLRESVPMTEAIRAEYFLQLMPSPLGLVEVGPNDQIFVDKMQLTRFYNPLILIQMNVQDPILNAVNDDLKEQAVISSYNRSGDSLGVIEVQPGGQENAFLQFKNTYDSHWKLTEISKRNFEMIYGGTFYKKYLALPKVLINALLSGESPVDVEGYSNAWDIDLKEDTTYFAVVFVSKYISDLLFGISLVVIMWNFRGVTPKKKKKKKWKKK